MRRVLLLSAVTIMIPGMLGRDPDLDINSLMKARAYLKEILLDLEASTQPVADARPC
jgi:hypothetical protein